MDQQSQKPQADSQTDNTQASNNVPKPTAETPKLIPAKKSTIAIMLLVFAIGVAVILWVWQIPPFVSHSEQTDNAYIRGNSTVLSSQISGYVDEVLVKDFDTVTQGQTLMRINTANYEQQVIQAQSNITAAKTNLDNQTQLIAQRKADIKVAQAQLTQAQTQHSLATSQLDRLQSLVSIGAVSQAEIDNARANVNNTQAAISQAQAGIEAAEQALKTAEVARTGLQAQVDSATAAAKQAETFEQYSIITAPISGQLGQVNVHNGQYVSTGTQLLYIVPSDTWVIANFKETQMKDIAIGQPATFSVDALGGATFTGVVDSISPATGSEFSVIKTDNATGNFTKVVQRISVRIRINPNQDALHRLRPGMSVIAKVDTTNTNKDP
ncbi:HlyD family secretion protein [Moraxella sp. FZLJ2107]|uniref:HlyD family secretion protein n=1 Tax=unclassified Moraxella TaxID=2685852 RepID=UPI0020C91AC1|nr:MULTISPECIES: HlyD family secretion protein [unclassified Moraxella]UTO05069.1 HlyD family secretion protein [Moraxella sp. FZLJ2107]UTO21804.1 HlyD family secretion protein [Moraxella sp. FZLJ2109]